MSVATLSEDFSEKSEFEKTDLVSGLQKVILSSIPAALIAADNDGNIITINEKARSMLALGDEEVAGLSLKLIFRCEKNPEFWTAVEQRAAVNGAEVRLRTSRGAGNYALTCSNILLPQGTAIGQWLMLSEIKRAWPVVAKTTAPAANFTFNDICRRNTVFRKMIDQVCVSSQSASNVLIFGESGTGKNILAQAIHNAGPRKNGPYVSVNCMAVSCDFLAGELFGYTEGTFAGLRRRGSPGKFELADGGTIFLDEIAEMPLDIQARLLRVIEDKCVLRIGGSQVRSVDVRIIAATHRDLLAEVSRGNFRKDLYYRLNILSIQLPPLRKRADDIPLLTEQFIQKYAKIQNKTIRGADQEVIDVFARYGWPGNVRELQNIVERMVNYATADRLTANLIPPEIGDARPSRPQRCDSDLTSVKEKKLIRKMLNLKLSKAHIARQLHMSRATLYRKLKIYGFSKTDASS